MTKPCKRSGGRQVDQLRDVQIELGAMKFAEGSARISFGDTVVLCAASVENRVPPFLSDSGRGWVTAEYSMLPRATHTRSGREVARGKPSGRTSEIQRLIGRALRASIDMKALGERTLTLDCDVIQADGGTRTASITGAYVAMVAALSRLYAAREIESWPIVEPVAAVSVGIVSDELLLDLEYVEDRVAQVDLNLVATESGRIVEVQGTAEQGSFAREELDQLVDLGLKGIDTLVAAQKQALASALEVVSSRSQTSGKPAGKPRDEATLWDKP